MTGVTFAIRYTKNEMAKVTRISTDGLSIARPVLTGNSRVDQVLWILSSILADIANESHRSNNDGDASAKNQIRQRMNKKNPPLINEVDDV
jgi:hypothetical protein